MDFLFQLIYFAMLVPVTTVLIVFARQYKVTKYQHARYLLLAWASFLVWSLSNGLGAIFQHDAYVVIATLAPVPLAMFTTLFVDSVTRTSYDPAKLSIVGASSIAKFAFLCEPGAITRITLPSGEVQIAQSPQLVATGVTLTLFVAAMYVFYMAKIYRRSPRNLRKIAMLSLVGAILIAFEPIYTLISKKMLETTGDSFSIPIFVAAGTLINILAFIQRSQLAFVLPFRATLLTVYETEGGIPLFTYQWDSTQKTEIADDLLSAVLQGTSGALNECLARGAIKEIHFESATLIIQRNTYFASAIVASKSSPCLRIALDAFTRAFARTFDGENRNVCNPGTFKSAQKLVEENFPFVPKY